MDMGFLNDHLAMTSIPSSQSNNAISIHNIMTNVLSHNNLMHMPSMSPIDNPLQNYPPMPSLSGSHMSNEMSSSPESVDNDGSDDNQMNSPGSPNSGMHNSHYTHHSATIEITQLNTPPQRSHNTPEPVSHHVLLSSEMEPSPSFKLEQI